MITQKNNLLMTKCSPLGCEFFVKLRFEGRLKIVIKIQCLPYPPSSCIENKGWEIHVDSAFQCQTCRTSPTKKHSVRQMSKVYPPRCPTSYFAPKHHYFGKFFVFRATHRTDMGGAMLDLIRKFPSAAERPLNSQVHPARFFAMHFFV